VRKRDRSTGAGRKGIDTFIKELIWREFYYQILAHFPSVVDESFREEFRGMPWRSNRRYFEAWRSGQTGYPIVDAAMRQLNAEGWMHNRARMIVASFLTKDLHIDWRQGQRHFFSRLIDADTASNSGGWQWTAGTGTDAAPYFRVMNPVLQGARFDPRGHYVRRYVPELASVPSRLIHEPWRLAGDDQRAMHCVIGKDFPAPIVDHAKERDVALQLYRMSPPRTAEKG